MASTKIIIARVPKSDQTKTVNMFPASRKAQILQRMAAAADASLGLKPSTPATKMSLPDENPAPRKRQRLTHLTPEEKMMRRKLKNRVAAQTARDRKKAQMDNLETSVGVTATLNKQLQMENALLRKQNQMLLAENKELKERLQVKKEDDTQSVVVLDHGYCLENVPSPPVSPPAMQLAGKPEVVVESPEPAAGDGSTLPHLPVHAADLESDDELLGLLGRLGQAAAHGEITLFSQDTDSALSSQAHQAGGTAVSGDPQDVVQAGQQQRAPGLVGPTAEELESIKELIQFDHKYLKPVEDVQNDCPEKSVTPSNHSSIVQMGIPMDMEMDSDCITQISDLDTTQSLKIDDNLDIDQLLAMGAEAASAFSFTNSDALTSDTSLTCDLRELIGLVGSKDCDARSQSGRSDYCSGSDSGISDAPRSPFSEDGGLGSPGGLGDSLWEESFTDLFPALDL